MADGATMDVDAAAAATAKDYGAGPSTTTNAPAAPRASAPGATSDGKGYELPWVSARIEQREKQSFEKKKESIVLRR